MITRVTLSDGSDVQVALVPWPNSYYPDAPHCVACDRREPDVTLHPCVAAVCFRKSRRACGRFCCTTCARQTLKGWRCPTVLTPEKPVCPY